MPRIAVQNPNPIVIIGYTPALPIGIGSGGKPGASVVSLAPTQVIGLIPLYPCDSKECREQCDRFEYVNPVFGELKGKSYQQGMTYENDWSTFYIDTSLFNANTNSVTITFILEKFFEGQWQPAPIGLTLNSNSYGILFPLGSIPSHPSYAGYAINWGSILFYKGVGCYRFKAISTFTTTVTTNGTVGGTQATVLFNLSAYSCALGAITGVLKTTSGNIPATYTINQTNPAFTIAQNVAYIVNLINTSSYPYTATQSGDSFTIQGLSYSLNNGITWNLNITKTGSCEFHLTNGMKNGRDGDPVTIQVVNTQCLVSPPFDLKKWDCIRAKGTVKFETWMTGIIGDPYLDYKKHDLCGMLFYDSIRVRGFFGYQKSPEYRTENLEWGNPQQGKIEHIRDEQIQRWEYISKYMPEYIHTRFSCFAMMCDRTFVSDYNINNSDYTLKRKNVIKDSGYEPEYMDKDAYWTRRHKAKVNVFFKRGVQSVEKSICCTIKN